MIRQISLTVKQKTSTLIYFCSSEKIDTYKYIKYADRRTPIYRDEKIERFIKIGFNHIRVENENIGGLLPSRYAV